MAQTQSMKFKVVNSKLLPSLCVRVVYTSITLLTFSRPDLLYGSTNKVINNVSLIKDFKNFTLYIQGKIYKVKPSLRLYYLPMLGGETQSLCKQLPPWYTYRWLLLVQKLTRDVLIYLNPKVLIYLNPKFPYTHTCYKYRLFGIDSKINLYKDWKRWEKQKPFTFTNKNTRHTNDLGGPQKETPAHTPKGRFPAGQGLSFRQGQVTDRSRSSRFQASS